MFATTILLVVWTIVNTIEDWEVFPDSKSVLVNQFSGGTNFPPTQIIFTKITRNVCTCDNGIATTGDTCADGEVKCSSCYPNYLLSVDNLCTLFDSTALATLTTDRDTLQSNSDTLQNELNNMTTDRNNLQDYNRTLTRDRNTLHQEKNGLILQLEYVGILVHRGQIKVITTVHTIDCKVQS